MNLCTAFSQKAKDSLALLSLAAFNLCFIANQESTIDRKVSIFFNGKTNICAIIMDHF